MNAPKRIWLGKLSTKSDMLSMTTQDDKDAIEYVRADLAMPASAAPVVDKEAVHHLICGVIHKHCKDLQLLRGINGLEADLIEVLCAAATAAPVEQSRITSKKHADVTDDETDRR